MLVLTVIDCVFTLSGTENKTGTGTRATTMGDGGPWPLSCFRCNMKASAKFHTTHLFPVPVPISVSDSV